MVVLLSLLSSSSRSPSLASAGGGYHLSLLRGGHGHLCDHALHCMCHGDTTERHNQVRDAFVEAAAAPQMHLEWEIG
eukprot:4190548-Amphidinium_carterae.1